MTITMIEKKLRPFEDPISHPFAKWLYLHFPPRPISSKKIYDHYRQAIDILLMELEGRDLNRIVRMAVQEYIKSVTLFLEDYERKEFHIGTASPEEVLRFLMEQNDLSQYDLADDLGGQPVVSDILNGKRKLTREHIERLSKRFNINPATFFPGQS